MPTISRLGDQIGQSDLVSLDPSKAERSETIRLGFRLGLSLIAVGVAIYVVALVFIDVASRPNDANIGGGLLVLLGWCFIALGLVACLISIVLRLLRR